MRRLVPAKHVRQAHYLPTIIYTRHLRKALHQTGGIVGGAQHFESTAVVLILLLLQLLVVVLHQKSIDSQLPHFITCGLVQPHQGIRIAHDSMTQPKTFEEESLPPNALSSHQCYLSVSNITVHFKSDEVERYGTWSTVAEMDELFSINVVSLSSCEVAIGSSLFVH